MSSLTTDAPVDSLLDAKRWLLPWVISIAMFIDTLDSTIVTVAIPHIANSFQINPVDMKLALTSYLLSLAVFIPISGWLADRHGEKKIFIFAVAVFTLGSILCAASTNLLFLIIARMIQGFGGALMMPVGRLIVLRNFPKNEFGRAMTLVVLPGLIGPALGPTIGGLILQVASWHWIFLVNIPFGIFTIIIASYIITPSAARSTLPFSWRGFMLFSLGLACLTLAMALLGDNFELLDHAILCATLGFFFLFLYWRVSSKQTTPLLDLALLQQQTFRTSIIVSLLVRLSVGAVAFLVPLFLQLLWDRSALFAGSTFMFLALGMFLSRYLLGPKLLGRYPIKRVLMGSVLSLLIFSMNLCWFGQPQPTPYLLILLFIIGMSTSLFYTCVGSMSVIELASEKYSQATSIYATMQQFSVGCGIAISAITLHFISKVTNLPLLSSEVFFWTFISLNSISLISVFFIMQLSPTLRLPTK